MTAQVLTFPQKRVRDARDAFPALLTQDEINAQEADKKRRARLASAWSFTKGVAMWLGFIALLGFIVGV